MNRVKIKLNVLESSREHFIFTHEENKMKESITIKDVARELGIHHVTVSRALRDTGSVKPETRELIKKTASELGYKPNRLAQDFRNKRSNVLAVVVPDLRPYFFAKFVSDFMEVAKEEGYSVMIFQTGEKPGVEKDIIDSLIGYRVAGVVASVTKDTVHESHFDVLRDESIPYVFFDRSPEEANASQVLVNNFQGAYDAVTAMIKSGKKRIAYISTHYRHQIFSDRLAGYKQALEDNNLPFHDSMVVEGGFFMKDGFAHAEKLMGLEEQPDGILAVRDEIGIGVIKYLKKAGFRVPEDVAVIGFDNDPMGVACEPELTTVQQSIPSMVSGSFELLLEQIKKNTLIIEKKVIEPKIIFRGSV
ncbi:LacI family DNA-binding transcriptional regulator [Flagellimonas myxillae]|uniref:LacI family DNA-binding transcriptional regulator n=1 Tax=Flagellimonas myxillae TaxID=2942214 RepID=UPI00201EC90D|nr:LacI family DNA-binding transcriptional regulator [Muricauda myxillae]MCL6268224.1 LacI family transcriptional regulator [Muricauda myxillae]